MGVGHRWASGWAWVGDVRVWVGCGWDVARPRRAWVGVGGRGWAQVGAGGREWVWVGQAVCVLMGWLAGRGGTKCIGVQMFVAVLVVVVAWTIRVAPGAATGAAPAGCAGGYAVMVR